MLRMGEGSRTAKVNTSLSLPDPFKSNCDIIKLNQSGQARDLVYQYFVIGIPWIFCKTVGRLNLLPGV